MVKEVSATRERVAETIFQALSEVNQLLPKGQQINLDLEVELIGTSSSLDSLGLVNLIVASEHRIEDEFGVEISLLDERAMSDDDSPFKTISSLVDYVLLRLEHSRRER